MFQREELSKQITPTQHPARRSSPSHRGKEGVQSANAMGCATRALHVDRYDRTTAPCFLDARQDRKSFGGLLSRCHTLLSFLVLHKPVYNLKALSLANSKMSISQIVSLNIPPEIIIVLKQCEYINFTLPPINVYLVPWHTFVPSKTRLPLYSLFYTNSKTLVPKHARGAQQGYRSVPCSTRAEARNFPPSPAGASPTPGAAPPPPPPLPPQVIKTKNTHTKKRKQEQQRKVQQRLSSVACPVCLLFVRCPLPVPVRQYGPALSATAATLQSSRGED